ncbi:hypothetical protein UVI_02058220 [Ustilaginoidea virens]|uniref:arginyltransferase n=1 Tax=Ustilaginoidea virens TaxID=1159556 RepID=A0A1B5L2L2_USTVR|nr:hypothetical protein UVI_02058220 [Ustilaginoidea virens]
MKLAGFSYYAKATSLSPSFYQTLLDRCWRRSGKLLYRPDQRRSCCPHYTIRLDSGRFRAKRDQRHAVNRFNKFVLGNSYLEAAARLHPKSREDTRKRDNHFSLVDTIHEAEYDRVKFPPNPEHKFHVTLEEDEFTEEKYHVYDNYQRVVHKDPPQDRSPQAFKRFLCSSPLRRETMVTADGRQRKLGSYHQCYRLDGVLVAIGVLDLLPDCVSSVYFLYHESIHKHAPGKLGALREIALASEAGYRWWYPGFYIHDCPKMRYKMDYSPQEIQDPDSLDWGPLDSSVLDYLDRHPFLNLSLLRETRLPNTPGRDVNNDEMGDSKKPRGSSTNDEQTVGDCRELTVNDGEGCDDGDDEDVRSLFESGMPGMKSLSEMMQVDLDHIAVKALATGPLYETSDLVVWDSQTMTEWPGIKASVAELVSIIGPDLMDSICLDMTR